MNNEYCKNGEDNERTILRQEAFHDCPAIYVYPERSDLFYELAAQTLWVKAMGNNTFHWQAGPDTASITKLTDQDELERVLVADGEIAKIGDLVYNDWNDTGDMSLIKDYAEFKENLKSFDARWFETPEEFIEGE